MPPRLSVVLVTHNSAVYVPPLMSMMSQLTYPDYEVIIVDNGSEDDTVGAITKSAYRSNLKLIRLHRNLGPGFGWNAGAKIAEGEYLCIMDPDTIVPEGFFPKMLEKYSKCNWDVGALIPVFASLDGNRLNDFGLVTLESPMDLQTRLSLRDVEVLFPPGACFLTRKRIFEEIGGFDKDLFWDFVDADIGWRLWIAGFRVISTSAAIAFHRDFTRYQSFRYYHYMKGLFAMQLKDWQLARMVYTIPFFLARCTYSIIRRQFPKETLSAILSALQESRQTLQKRRQVQKTRRIDDKELMRVLWFFMPVPWIRKSWRDALRKSRNVAQLSSKKSPHTLSFPGQSH